MTTASTSFSAQALHFLASAGMLLASATLPACGTSAVPDTSNDAELDAALDDEHEPASDAETDAARPGETPPEHDADVADLPDSAPGRDVEVFEAGTGNVTVVFEAGLGDDWTPWKEVARQLATRTRVFAYSRPGYGASDRSEDPRDATHILEDLRTLLAARAVTPPYVLVGHSFGGAYMELFAKAHPEPGPGPSAERARAEKRTQSLAGHYTSIGWAAFVFVGHGSQP